MILAVVGQTGQSSAFGRRPNQAVVGLGLSANPGGARRATALNEKRGTWNQKRGTRNGRPCWPTAEGRGPTTEGVLLDLRACRQPDLMVAHFDPVLDAVTMEIVADLFGLELDESDEAFITPLRGFFSCAALGLEHGIE